MCNLPRLAPAVLALFPVCQVHLLLVKELCPRTVDFQSAIQLAHRRIALLNPFQQQLRTAESRVHLQEHQGHFLFRSEEQLASQLRSHAFPDLSSLPSRGDGAAYLSCPILQSFSFKYGSPNIASQRAGIFIHPELNERPTLFFKQGVPR